VMSFLLISWFNGRQLARNGAFLAFNINRLGDLLLFFGILFGFIFFIVLSLLTKSSMWIFSTWLPNAMEGPTPVSALLHSSTMVVAGVFLVQFFNFLCFHIILVLLIYGTYMGAIGYKFRDYKWIIAYSTSSQLVLVGVFGLIGTGIFSLLYVTVHAFFKSLMFMSCGWSIHGNFLQWVCSNYNLIFFRSFLFCVFNMIRFFGLSVSLLKDQVLLFRNYLIIIIFFFYACATLFYSISLLKVSSYGKLKFQESGIFILSFILFTLFNFSFFFLGFSFFKVSLIFLLLFFSIIYLLKNFSTFFFTTHLVDIYYSKINLSFNIGTYQFFLWLNFISYNFMYVFIFLTFLLIF